MCIFFNVQKGSLQGIQVKGKGNVGIQLMWTNSMLEREASLACSEAT